MKLAIIGGGPSAFYVASRLLSRLPERRDVRVHVFDRLWAPHGLVRYGVAPDHPEVKNCTNKFDLVAADPRFRFFGNVNVGAPAPKGMPDAVQLPLEDLQAHYSHLVFATGCALPAVHSALAASPWVLPALEFVHWYTQHPSAPPPPPLDTLTHVALIGNGNVALDVARMLLTPPAVLEKYDVPRSVLDILALSTVRHVDIVARRGPLQAAFTAKELRELTNLPDAAMKPLDPALVGVPPGASRQQSRILALLAKGSQNAFGTTSKTWALEFFKSPTGLTPPPAGERDPELQLVHTALDSEGRAVPTGETSSLRTSLVVPSLGFRGEPDFAAGFFDATRGHLRARMGRVVTPEGHAVRNVYAAGWAATGARGVLATTMMAAYGVADAVLQDAGLLGESAPLDVVDSLPMNPAPSDDLPPTAVRAAGRVVSYEDWKRVDAEEIRRGEALNKERERMGWEQAAAFLGNTSSVQ
ncbi:hypothetical protein C8R43DRAFT_999564 [Mycena crocata]|nr:hypothetical protein C8R43DRAFT_999564 [Mycena crocata]